MICKHAWSRFEFEDGEMRMDKFGNLMDVTPGNIKCKICGKDFVPDEHMPDFCSRACFKEHSR